MPQSHNNGRMINVEASVLPGIEAGHGRWQVLPLKRIVQINREELPQTTLPDTILQYVDIGNVTEHGLIEPPKEMTFGDSPSRARRVVQARDTILSTVRTYLKAVAFFQKAPNNLIASTGFAVLSPPPSISAKYIYYLIQGHMFISLVEAESKGINYPAITPVELGRLKIVFTSNRAEQDAIVTFLDKKLADIDRYIAAKQRLIKLLNEQKAVIINQAVTRGLDSKVEMKASGIEWLETIPSHWQATKLKHLFREKDEKSQTGEEILLSLRMYEGLVEHNEVSDKPITKQQLIGYKLTRPGEIVMNRMRAAIGLFAVTPRLGLVSPDYAIFEAIAKVLPEYYVYLFKTPTMRTVFGTESKGLGTGSSGFLRLYSDRFGVIKVPYPPYEEQEQIVTHIKSEVAALSETIAVIEREIELMQELRIALIAEAVTGKLVTQS